MWSAWASSRRRSMVQTFESIRPGWIDRIKRDAAWGKGLEDGTSSGVDKDVPHLFENRLTALEAAPRLHVRPVDLIRLGLFVVGTSAQRGVDGLWSRAAMKPRSVGGSDRWEIVLKGRGESCATISDPALRKARKIRAGRGVRPCQFGA